MSGHANLSTGLPYEILLVEDNPIQQQIVSTWLSQRLGARVSIVSDGAQGLQQAQQGAWDLIISDIEMPGASGMDVLRHSKQTHRSTPTLLITAHQRIEYALEALQCKADDMIFKPLQRDIFVDKVSALIEDARRERQQQRKTVLAIGAHPDDIEIGCAGTLLKHIETGDSVNILTLTQGSRGGTSDVRRLEAEHAASLLGAELVMEDLRDTAISDGPETISLIEHQIARIAPDVIYTHTLQDRHQDHRATHLATMIAARRIDHIYCYQSPSTKIDFRPTRFVDITEVLPRKIELIAAHASQYAVRPYMQDDHVCAVAAYWGRFADYVPSEAFEVARSK